MRTVKKINMKSASLFLTNKEMKQIDGGYNGEGGVCPEGCCGTCVYFECKTELGAYRSGFACTCGEAMLKCNELDGVYCQNME